MTAGRPTKYNAEIQKAADHYLDTYDTVIPTIAGLCLAINISKPTVYEWDKDERKPDFTNSVRRLNHIQESKLLEGGLTSEMNPTITRLVLNNHGYSEKQEITGAEGKPLFEGVAVQFVKATDTDS